MRHPEAADAATDDQIVVDVAVSDHVEFAIDLFGRARTERRILEPGQIPRQVGTAGRQPGMGGCAEAVQGYGACFYYSRSSFTGLHGLFRNGEIELWLLQS